MNNKHVLCAIDLIEFQWENPIIKKKSEKKLETTVNKILICALRIIIIRVVKSLVYKKNLILTEIIDLANEKL